MPTVGSGSRSFGDIPNIPEKLQAGMRYGIHYFEMRYPRPLTMHQQIFGVFDVRVKETYDTVLRKMNFSTEWITGGAGCVNFKPDSKKVGTAWLPDDKYWHNRIFLMDTPILRQSVVAYHTADGMYPGGTVLSELLAMRDVLKEPTKIYKVCKKGQDRDINFFYDKDSALGYVEENTQILQRIDPTTGIIKNQKAKTSLEVVEGSILEYKPEIKKLINKENRTNEFGWTQSKEFQNVWKPKILELIEERKKDMAENPSGKIGNILSSVSSLPEDQLEELRQIINGRTKDSEHSDTLAINAEKNTLDFDPFELHTKMDYRKMKKEKLIKILTARGVENPQDINWTAMCDKLFEMDTKTLEEQNNEGELVV